MLKKPILLLSPRFSFKGTVKRFRRILRRLQSLSLSLSLFFFLYMWRGMGRREDKAEKKIGFVQEADLV